jgi:organic radical activating enzyme
MKSEYDEFADKAESQLNKISKTMCYAKWSQASINLANGMTNSCYHPPLHSIDLNEVKVNPKALHNTAQKKKERAEMLKGIRPKGCSYCWNIEDIGNRSDRIYRSGEYWAQNSRNDIFDVLADGDIEPRYLEINFNQACNLKCMYCSPHLSTAWEDHVYQHGDYEVFDSTNNLVKHNNLNALLELNLLPKKMKQADNPYLQAFWKWWPELYNKLEIFRITGGEPLVDNNTFEILDYIYNNPNTSLELSITTNLCPPTHTLFDKFLGKIKKLEEIQIWEDKNKFNPGSGNYWYVNPSLKNFSLFVSLDSVGKQAEYIRDGLNFSVLEKNVNSYLEQTFNSTLTFINTFNALSLPKFTEFLKFVLDLRKKYNKDAQGIKKIPIYDPYYKHPDYEVHPKQRIWFDIPLLRNPEWMNILVLPNDFDKYFINAIEFMEENSDTSNFEGFYDFEINKCRRNLEYFQKSNSNTSVNRKNFVKFFKQYDQKRNTDFLQTFPELKNFWYNNV